MTQQELIDFLTANLKLQAENHVSPWDYSDHQEVELVLNDQVISSVVLDINDGQ